MRMDTSLDVKTPPPRAHLLYGGWREEIRSRIRFLLETTVEPSLFLLPALSNQVCLRMLAGHGHQLVHQIRQLGCLAVLILHLGA